MCKDIHIPYETHLSQHVTKLGNLYLLLGKNKILGDRGGSPLTALQMLHAATQLTKVSMADE